MMADNKTPKMQKDGGIKTGFFSEMYDWLSSVFSAVLCFIIIFTLGVRLITVDGTSMLPTLENSERLIVSDLFYTPQFGDIVILYADKLIDYENKTQGKPIVKRVIGLPGDTIRIDFERGIVYRNGEALQEEYTRTPTNLDQGFPDNTDVVVEEGKVFVMGDNRNQSKDSRNLAEVGQVDIRYIMGKAYFRVWPLNKFGAL